MSPFRLFGRPDTEAEVNAEAVPPAEHAAWSGAAPAYRPPHSGGSARRPAADRAERKGRRGRGARHAPPGDGAPESASWQDAGLRWAASSTAWGAARPRYGANGSWGQAGNATAPPPRNADGSAATIRRGATSGAACPGPGAAGGAATTRWGAAPGHADPPPLYGANGGTAATRGSAATHSGAAAAAQWGAASAAGAAAAGWAPDGDCAAIPWGTPRDTSARRGGSGGYGVSGGAPRNGHGGGAAWSGPLTSGDPRVDGDPPTDPRGFPPVPAFSPVAPHAAEAAALAGAFAVDYLSWDEDDPERRGRVLVDYLPTPGRDPARLGWTGKGRQRAEFALPGLVRSDGDGRVLVDVRVRVTTYVAVGTHSASPEPADANVPGALAAAPAPTGRGWRSLASTWIRLSVPVTFDGGRMVIDAWDETLGEEPPLPTRPAASTDDHTLADDDPLQEPAAGGTP
jgi:hypothetical protein